MGERRNIAGGVGAWSARHPKTAILGWLAFVIVALAIGSAVPTGEITDADRMIGENAEAARILEEAGVVQPASEMVLVQPRAGSSRTDVDQALEDLVARLGRSAQVEHLVSPLTPAGAGLQSADGHSRLVTFDIVGDPETASERIDPVIETVRAAAQDHPTVRVEQFGGTSADKALDGVMENDFQRAELLSLPITLLVLLLTFGALVAAVLPLALALTAFVGALGLVGLASQLLPVDGSARTVMLLIGLAVGVDYSLFYLKREREERARGASPTEALRVAAATAGRSVLISGLTVMVAMAGMFLTGFAVFTGMGMATILVVMCSVVGSLTVLPALMGVLGDRVERGRLPLRRRRPARTSSWHRLLDAVLRRPLAAALAAGIALAALATPALGLDLRNEGVEDLPQDLPVMQTYQRIRAAFPGGSSPAEVVVRGEDVTAPAMQDAIAQLRRAALDSGRMNEPITVETSADGTVAVVSVPLDGDGEDAASTAALSTLRTLAVETVGAVEGTTVKVTGATAESAAFKDLMRERTPWVFGFVLFLACLLLLASFRSLVVAGTAIVLNLLGVAASYGALVLVFQHGVGAELIGLGSTGAVVNWVPLFLFVILFGLSMDYHVLILSRITEARARGLQTTEAIADGIKASAGVVTSAAVIMVCVFLCFVGLSMTSLKQVGLGLAIAVLIDATVVRVVLLPAVMTLLGERNWYLPRWLDRLPAVEHGVPAPDPVVPSPTGTSEAQPDDDEERLLPVGGRASPS